MTARLLSTIAALAASVTLGANLISGGSAQAAIFDFNAVWNDNTTTKGWFEVDDTPDWQGSYSGHYDYKSWQLNSVLDADFTHEGTRHGKSNLTYLSLYNYNFSEGGYYQSYYGNVANFLSLGLNNQNVYFNDYGVGGSPNAYSDYGYKYTNSSYYGASAASLSVVERAAKAVPEPTTMAGLALVGIGIAATRRKQIKALVKV